MKPNLLFSCCWVHGSAQLGGTGWGVLAAVGLAAQACKAGGVPVRQPGQVAPPVVPPFLQVLVLAPTREIALQASEAVALVAAALPPPGLACGSFIGGLPVEEDEKQLRRWAPARMPAGLSRTNTSRCFSSPCPDGLQDARWRAALLGFTAVCVPTSHCQQRLQPGWSDPRTV